MIQPNWVSELVNSVALIEGRKHPPRIKWVKRNRHSTSGVYYRHSKRITIRVGNDQLEKQVLIHELAHWLTRKGHNKRFWLKCFNLLKRHDLLTEEYKKREFRYKKKASIIFDQMI